MLCGLIQPRQPEKEINFPRATLVGYSNAICLRLGHPSINYTPLHAVKTRGHPVKGSELNLSSQVTKATTSSRKVPILVKASLVEVTITVDIFVKASIIFEGIPGGDICSDGNQEGSVLKSLQVK